MARKLALALALLGAMASSGCVVVKQESAAQVDGIGDAVRISAKVCLNNTSPANGPDCAADFVGVGDYQGLLALRVPADLEPPETVTTDLAGVTLTASPSYASELERTVPAGDGLQWAGYISPPRSFVAESGPPPAGFVVNVTAELALPAGAAGEISYQVVGGYRQISPDTTPSPDAPVACADTPGQALAGTTCVDQAEPDTLTVFHQLALAGVALTGPAAPVGVQAGRTGSLTFAAAVTGAPEGVELSASTTVPGATATPAVASLVSSVPVPVSVVVPAGTAAGDYAVTLKATSGDTTRAATGTLRVTAPPAPPPPPAGDATAPELTVKPVKGQTPRRVARKGLKLRLTLSEAATVTGGLAKGRPVAKALPEGASTLKLKLKRKPGKALKRKRKARLALELLATDAAGNATSVGRTVRVRRPR